MTRFTTTAALAAFIALGSVAANAADVPGNAIQSPGASFTVDATPRAQSIVRAGDVYTAEELVLSGMSESDILELPSRPQVAVRAGDVYSTQELIAAGLNGSDVLTVSNFAGNGQSQTRESRNSWRIDR
ncbi:MAG: hypothetical protein ACK4GT_08505 [Pararhodobacter sp.]